MMISQPVLLGFKEEKFLVTCMSWNLPVDA